MIRFLENPNLPKGRVKAVICGELCAELNGYLDLIGIERLVINPNIYIDPAVKYHADMSALHIGKNKIVLSENQQVLYTLLKERGFEVSFTSREIKGEYPDDIALNLTVIGDKILGKLSFADETALGWCSYYSKIDVRQGYCKCSCLVVRDNALITDDESVYKIAVKNCLDCLLISKGDVLLPGHQYGFIGGASGKISENEVLFFGDITAHRDYKKIAGFIEKHGCRIISLDFPLTDFGGIIPIIEEA